MSTPTSSPPDQADGLRSVVLLALIEQHPEALDAAGVFAHWRSKAVEARRASSDARAPFPDDGDIARELEALDDVRQALHDLQREGLAHRERGGWAADGLVSRAWGLLGRV